MAYLFNISLIKNRKMKKITLLVLVICASFTINGQTADEVLDTYFENIGGKENFKKLDGIKLTISINQGGMQIPVEVIRLKGGKQFTSYDLQGKTLYQGVFDGETLWGSNQMTMKAEKSPAEDTANHKLTVKDFPDPFLDYKEKGYDVVYEGKETIDGTETFKIKLTQTPKTIDEKKVDHISFYFFDTENYVPIAMQQEILSGPGKGMVSQVTFSDYQEVDGLYFAHSMTMGAKGQPGGMVMTISKVELNPTVEESVFTFPEEITEKKE